MKKYSLLLSLTLSWNFISAVLVEPKSLKLALDDADLIAEILVLQKGVRPHQDLYAESISEAQILNVKKSKSDDLENSRLVGTQIKIITQGGELKDRGVLFAGLPRPQSGKRYQAALKSDGQGAYSIVGFEQGLVPLDSERAFSRNRTDGSNGSGDGAFLFWDSSFFPIPYYISLPTFKNLPHFIPAIESSFSTWRAPEDVRVEFLSLGCSNASRNENDGMSTIILIKSDWAFDPAAIAITRNFYVAGDGDRAGQILDSDILLNGVNHGFTTTNESGKHDVQNILTHEIGHFLGLGHEVTPADSEASMFSVASPNETKKRVLRTSDLNGLRAAYAGVGEKFRGNATRCEIPKDNVGCLSTHDRPFDLKGMTGFWLYLGFTLGLGRWFAKRPKKTTPTSSS